MSWDSGWFERTSGPIARRDRARHTGAQNSVLLSVHRFGADAIALRNPILSSSANGDDRPDLMLFLQPVDQLLVVVALPAPRDCIGPSPRDASCI